ncbi:MAG TPA: GntR family transcriptional regulator [Desulfobacterales bacterium]
MLNPQSPIPLYRQLADVLLAKIRAGEYQPGERIPSEHQLASEYSIGRPTVRQAIDQLVRKNLLKRRRGSGTFVCRPWEEVGLFSLDGTTASFRRRGLKVATRILETIRLKPIDGDSENPFMGREAYFLSRLTRVADSPVLIEDMYFHPELFAGIDAMKLEGRSLSEIAEESFYMRPVRGKQNFRIGTVGEGKARALGVRATTPILIVKRFLHFPQADNAFFSALFCRTDQFVFSQTLGGNADA